LVAATRAAAKARKLRDDGVAVIVVSAVTGPQSPERIAALQGAITDAGLSLGETLVLDADVLVATSTLAARLTADPKITMLFAEDDHGMSCSAYLARETLKDRPFILAGYANLSAFGSFVIVEGSAAVADRNEGGFIATAFDAALKLSRGEDVPRRIEVPVTVRRRGRKSSTADQGGDHRPDAG
jgi:hypothetical protein